MQFTNPSANHSRQTGSPMPFVPQHMSPRESKQLTYQRASSAISKPECQTLLA